VREVVHNDESGGPGTAKVVAVEYRCDVCGDRIGVGAFDGQIIYVCQRGEGDDLHWATGRDRAMVGRF
jgi:hypothetical protein